MSAPKAVELPLESWRTVQAVLLRAALEMEADGLTEESTDLMNLVVPVIGLATDSEEAEGLEQQVRTRLGLPVLGSTVGEVPA